MKPPSAPPPLTAMAKRKEQLEDARAVLFEKWRCALEDAHGNVTRAAAAMGFTRNRGNKLTKRFELVDYAKRMRVKAIGRAMGTWKTP